MGTDTTEGIAGTNICARSLALLRRRKLKSSSIPLSTQEIGIPFTSTKSHLRPRRPAFAESFVGRHSATLFAAPR